MLWKRYGGSSAGDSELTLREADEVMNCLMVVCPIVSGVINKERAAVDARNRGEEARGDSRENLTANGKIMPCSGVFLGYLHIFLLKNLHNSKKSTNFAPQS